MLAERIAASQLADLSAQNAGLSGSLRPGDLPRLSGLLASGAGIPEDSLDVTVRFSLGPEGLPLVQIRAQGWLHLVCQRCLGPVRWPFDVDVSLTAVRNDAEADGLADPFDSVLLEDGELPLRLALEDEILAVLPMAPLHEDAAQCGKSAAGPRGDDQPARPNRPFADLATLMGRGAGGKGQS